MKGKEQHQPTKNTIDTKFVFEFPLCGARIQVPYIHTRHDPKQKSSPPTHSCPILSFSKLQQNFTRLYLFYQSCKSFFTPFYWINGKKMTSSSHTNLATSTISESHICKPQNNKNGTSLSFSLSLTIFRVLRWYIAPSLESLLHFLHFHWILLLWVSTQFATKSYEMMWFESFEWVVCLTQKFPWRRCHACMHA